MTALSTPMETRRVQNSCSVPFEHGHNDLIHGVAYDYYGERLATCSSDQRIIIYDLNDEGVWEENDNFRAHDASISKVAWASPEFGQIVASCSFDRSVRVFEEQETEAKRTGRRWRSKCRFHPEFRRAIYDLSFAPVHSGLKLAYISSDGVVRVEEATEPHNIQRWINIEEFRVIDEPPLREVETSFCLSYCPSRWGGEQLVVGAMDKARIYRHNSQGKYKPAEELPGHKGLVRDVSWAPNLGRGYHLIATASKDHKVRIFRLTDSRNTFSSKPAGTRPPSRSRDHSSSNNKQPNMNEKGEKTPNMGLTREKSNLGGNLNTSSQSNIQPSTSTGGQQQQHGEEDETLMAEIKETRELQGFDVELIADFDDHHREVWRVEWNATGTILSSAGDDGKIRLWKADKTMKFNCMSIISSNWRPSSRRADEDED